MRAMDEENTQTRAKLQAEAAALTIPEIVERVREGVAEFVAAARAIPEDALSKPLAEGGQTASECITHAIGETIENARWILHGAWMGFGPEDPRSDPPEGRGAQLAKMDEALESLYVHVNEAAPDGNLDYLWTNAMLGELNWREWLLFLRVHAKDHAERLRAGARAN